VHRAESYGNSVENSLSESIKGQQPSAELEETWKNFLRAGSIDPRRGQSFATTNTDGGESSVRLIKLIHPIKYVRGIAQVPLLREFRPPPSSRAGFARRTGLGRI